MRWIAAVKQKTLFLHPILFSFVLYSYLFLARQHKGIVNIKYFNQLTTIRRLKTNNEFKKI